MNNLRNNRSRIVLTVCGARSFVKCKKNICNYTWMANNGKDNFMNEIMKVFLLPSMKETCSQESFV